MASEEPAPIAGIYFLFREGRLTYIGRSRDAEKRIKTHRKNGREFDRWLVAPCAEGDQGWIEAELIRSFDSVQNRTRAESKVEAELLARLEKAKRPIVMNRIVNPHPADLPAENSISVAMGRARSYASQCRLSPEFVRDVESGDLPFTEGPLDSRGNRRKLFRVGALREWSERLLSAKAA